MPKLIFLELFNTKFSPSFGSVIGYSEHASNYIRETAENKTSRQILKGITFCLRFNLVLMGELRVDTKRRERITRLAPEGVILPSPPFAPVSAYFVFLLFLPPYLLVYLCRTFVLTIT